MTDDSDIRRPPAQWRICELLQHSGLGFSSDERQRLAAGGLLKNGAPAAPTDTFAGSDCLTIDGVAWRIDCAQPRPQLVAEAPYPAGEITAPVRVHAGYHKCLTMYSRRVYEKLCKSGRGSADAFRHFYHRVDHFYHAADRYLVTSISGHCLELDRFRDIRVVRFVRDPRDLLISGYFYHRAAREAWCELDAPTDTDWQIVNGRVPSQLERGESLTHYLNRVSLAEGLLAEIEFRRAHYDSMLAWSDDPRVRVYRYEDILGNEAASFAGIARFLGLPLRARLNARRYANRFRIGRPSASRAHIRNPKPGQWRKHFTPAVERAFEEAYGGLLTRYGYR